uniref:Alkylated DNA repair protein AlkB homologue 8 N-terminal domain-containing protein n=1 Tax=Knipowitschia caucasica TaxID=637954 RepID=A0AAV2MEP4_KNICA
MSGDIHQCPGPVGMSTDDVVYPPKLPTCGSSLAVPADTGGGAAVVLVSVERRWSLRSGYCVGCLRGSVAEGPSVCTGSLFVATGGVCSDAVAELGAGDRRCAIPAGPDGFRGFLESGVAGVSALVDSDGMAVNLLFSSQLDEGAAVSTDTRNANAIKCVVNKAIRLNRNHDSVKLIKFADDTTLIGLISNNDESAYRREVDRLVSWCSGNNLELNAQKTVEMIVDFRKSTVPPPPPSVMDSPITSVESFRFLGTTITQDLKWEPTISSLIKKAQQRMYFLRQLRKAKLPAQMLVQFYTAIIESILTSSITVWFAGATVRDKQRLQRIVRSAEEVIGRSLPSLQDLYVA